MPIDSHPSERANPMSGPAVGLSPEEALPGLAMAFDEEAMRGYLQAALFGSDRPGYTVERCPPTRPLYVPGEYCLVRYRLRARESASGEVLKRIVMGRVFPDGSACAAYTSAKLAPLAARMRGRPEVAAFAAPAAVIDPLHMAVHVWPIDGELPTLVDATDRERMIDVFQETLPERLGESFLVEDCQVELVSYRRRQRCLLRYTVAGKAAGDEVRRVVVYGKVTAFANETIVGGVIDALRDRMGRYDTPYRFRVPRSLGSRPDLQLSLLEALPGEALIGPTLEARLRDEQPLVTTPLEEMVASCGHVAATLHTSGVALGRARTLAGDLAALRREAVEIRTFVPHFGDQAHGWLERIAARAEQSDTLPLRLGHGDFKYEQVLFDGAGSGLVDFDRVCQAEPTLDLGTFLAHLRIDARKLRASASTAPPLVEELAEQFLRAYVTQVGAGAKDEGRLRLRAALYEALALVRLALRSQQDLDERGVQIATSLLDDRTS